MSATLGCRRGHWKACYGVCQDFVAAGWSLFAGWVLGVEKVPEASLGHCICV